MAKKRVPQLKIEQINSKFNCLYLALIEYKRENFLALIDNIRPGEIGAYVLDYADQENIPVNEFISIATNWFYASSHEHPFSIELSKRGLTDLVQPIYRTFDSTYVSRIVGHAFAFDHLLNSKVKRRRVIPVPEGVEIRIKSSTNKNQNT